MFITFKIILIIFKKGGKRWMHTLKRNFLARLTM